MGFYASITLYIVIPNIIDNTPKRVMEVDTVYFRNMYKVQSNIRSLTSEAITDKYYIEKKASLIKKEYIKGFELLKIDIDILLEELDILFEEYAKWIPEITKDMEYVLYNLMKLARGLKRISEKYDMELIEGNTPIIIYKDSILY
jgi:hypothetical protein